MRTLTLSAALAFVLAASLTGPAEAKGCIKGAIVGGVAGHMAHHGVLGAAGGCAVGHRWATRCCLARISVCRSSSIGTAAWRRILWLR